MIEKKYTKKIIFVTTKEQHEKVKRLAKKVKSSEAEVMRTLINNAR